MLRVIREIPIKVNNGFKAMDKEECAKKYDEFQIPPTDLFCNWTFDKVLCWPPTKAGSTTSQQCPSIPGSDDTMIVHKRCSFDGTWEGLTPNDTSRGATGYTNYKDCLVPEVRDLFDKLDTGGSDAGKNKMDIAWKTRKLEMVGLSVSLVSLIASLIIFYHFRGLRNNRTRIHKNLFLAMVVQVNVRLTLYIDQYLSSKINIGIDIEHTPYLCEGSYVLLEYARTAMFMWMFVEGLYLHNVITVTVFQEHSYYVAYSFLGWGAPAIMTASWALTMAFQKHPTTCWLGYNLLPYFWIVEGPRLTVILLNFLFLLNIIRVLVVKLRQSHTSEIEQVRKAVRAALVLLPLLGIANILTVPGVQTLDKEVWEFALWSYTAHFITSFQGFFISCIYCFFNGEVRTVMMKSVSVYLSLRGNRLHQPRRNSFVSGYYETGVIPPVISTLENDNNDVTIVKPLKPNRYILPNCAETINETRTNHFIGNETRV